MSKYAQELKVFIAESTEIVVINTKHLLTKFSFFFIYRQTDFKGLIFPVNHLKYLPNSMAYKQIEQSRYFELSKF